SAAPDPKALVAEVDGEKITYEDLDKVIGSQLIQLQSQAYEIKSQGIDAIVEKKLFEKEAKKRGISVEELLKVEVLGKIGDISDQEVAAIYNQNKAQFAGHSLEELSPAIKQQLRARQAASRRQSFLDSLKAQAKITVLLKPFRIEVGAGSAPGLGPESAPVQIIEFTDYECPYCGRAHPIVQQVLQTYGDKVHYVLRDFPLEFHSSAKKAAEAAHCAGDQDKYWPYGEVLWKNQKALDVASLKKYAAELKLDTQKFDACLDEGKYSAEVEKNIADGIKAGVNGTPAFFIN
ncbi:MAG TPA: hypothetical protein DF383_00330, partial [Deltaproteobacteria bacterium]|nr:hypothetical protein [Deltaproteobacteria bacterium]